MNTYDEGKDGEKAMLLINLKRKRIQEVYNYFNFKFLKYVNFP